jgi:FkbM family methyltransferase
MKVADAKILLAKEDAVVLEIGAHYGEDTAKFLDEFKEIVIYCFEPDIRCISKFKKNIKDKRCTLIEAAVSGRDGKAVLNLSSGWPVTVPALFRRNGLSRIYISLVLKLRRILGREWDMSSSIKKSVSHPMDWPWLTYDKTIEVATIKLDTFRRKII